MLSFIALIGAVIALFVANAARNASERNAQAADARLAELSARLAAIEPPPVRPEAAPVEPAAAETEAPPVRGAPPPPEYVPPSPVPAGASIDRFEDRLMRRWIAWLGALALALGIVFLVKYTIEHGMFGPALRIASGIALSLVLVAAGEWTRRRKPNYPAGLPIEPDYIPPGLTAAGIVGLFASLYAGYALYALIPALVAFALLAGVSVAAALLATLHGWFIALLGFVGAYVVPALIATPNPTAAGLLVYVFLVTAGALMLLRWQRWKWLGWSVTAGAMVWAGMALLMEHPDRPLGLYLVAMPALFVLTATADTARASIWAAAIADAVLMIVLVGVAGYSTETIVFASVLALLLAGLGWRDPAWDRLAWIGAVMELALLAAWEFERASVISPPSSFVILAPPGRLQPYLGYAAGVAAFFGIGGALASQRAARPGRWALLSAGMPVAILAITYWRAELLAQNFLWAALALALAGVNVFATERLRPSQPASSNAVLAAYAVAAVASLSLGFGMALRLGWFTIALSLQLPALVWLFERTEVRAIRTTALIVAAVVLVRLLFNPSLADYDIGRTPIFNGLLYLYGVPWLAFLVATRGFRRSGEDALVHVLEAGTIALFVAMISLEIRHAVHGTIVSRRYDLLEQGLLSDAWFAISLGIMPRRGEGSPHWVREAAWQVLLAGGALNLLLFPLFRNPFFVRESVGTVLIVDALLFAYFVPGVFAALFYRAFHRRSLAGLAGTAGIAALLLVFIYLSFETRHFFHGAYIDLGYTSDAEWYVYSAVWLVYSAALLVVGLRFGWRELRLAGIAIGALATIKVFLFDMAALSGLLRAASFLGLGVCLVALGYLYQRVLAVRSAPAD